MMGMNEIYAAVASALSDESKRRRAKIAGLIERLETSIAAVGNAGKRLPQAIGVAVDARLEAAAQQAAAAIASWSRATAHAERAAAMYRREADLKPRKILALSLIVIGLGLAAMVSVACSGRTRASWQATCRGRDAGRNRAPSGTQGRPRKAGTVPGREEARAALLPGR